jgi:hypothetical protein
LVIVARAAEENHERDFAAYLRETADAWNAQIESDRGPAFGPKRV